MVLPPVVQPPDGRKAVFLGDLVDRGTNTPAVLRLVMNMGASRNRAARYPRQPRREVAASTSGQKRAGSRMAWPSRSRNWNSGDRLSFRPRSSRFWMGLISHYVLDDGKLVVAHAGLRGKSCRDVDRAPCVTSALYGETTGETDEFGLPVRHNWAAGNIVDRAMVGLWPHARARARVAQSDDQYRHRLCVWRTADGAALSRAELVSVPAGDLPTSRPGRSCRAPGGAGARPRPARHHRCHRPRIIETLRTGALASGRRTPPRRSR